jgi:ComF family protein
MIRTEMQQLGRALLSQLTELARGQCRVCGLWCAGVAPSAPLRTGLCAACEARFAPRGLLRCATCAQRLPESMARGERSSCGGCVANPPVVAQTIAALDYGHPWNDWIARLKFHDDVGIAGTLGALMADASGADDVLNGASAVIPVPRSRERLRERGYNPAALLAQAALKSRGQPKLLNTAALRRWRHGPSQRELDADQRKSNVLRAFEPTEKNALQGQTVVIVDDLWTTGATVNAVARAALDAGAREVRAWVLARTPLD